MATILVVDDEAALREVIRLSLESGGYDVIEAANGREAIDLAGKHLPDLILCDVKMQEMDGYRTLAALRQRAATASIPCILMTGQADPKGMRQGMELGADDYLPKPFQVTQLLAAVDVRLKKQETLRVQAERRLAELRANISLALPHELLTPLNGIFGFADLLIADAESLQPAEIVNMAEAIRESGQRLHRLIQNFLFLAQVELHKTDLGHFLQGAPVLDLRALVERVAPDKADKLFRSADLKMDLAGAQAVGREEYCTKLVEELLDNAFKFSPTGSLVQVELNQKDGTSILRISDRGRGMKSEHLAGIGAYMQFERKLYEQQGSGLGLALAKQVAELHRGSLSITSEVGRGTTVEVRLPSAA
jgi:two-component system, sensor histidine kinase and response regulator